MNKEIQRLHEEQQRLVDEACQKVIEMHQHGIPIKNAQRPKNN